MRWWRLPIEERAGRKTDLGGGYYYLRNSVLPPSADRFGYLEGEVASPFISYYYNSSSDKYVLNQNFNGSIYAFGYMVPDKNVSLEETISLDFLMDVEKCKEDRLKIFSLDLSEVTDQINASNCRNSCNLWR